MSDKRNMEKMSRNLWNLVFKYLNFLDAMKCAMVCHKFYDVLNSSDRLINFKIPLIPRSKVIPPKEFISDDTLKEVLFKTTVDKIVPKYNLNKVDLSGLASITNISITRIIMNSPMLEHLNIMCCRQINLKFINDFNKTDMFPLVSLNLIGINSGYSLESKNPKCYIEFVGHFPNLEKIQLANAHMSFITLILQMPKMKRFEAVALNFDIDHFPNLEKAKLPELRYFLCNTMKKDCERILREHCSENVQIIELGIIKKVIKALENLHKETDIEITYKSIIDLCKQIGIKPKHFLKLELTDKNIWRPEDKFLIDVFKKLPENCCVYLINEMLKYTPTLLEYDYSLILFETLKQIKGLSCIKNYIRLNGNKFYTFHYNQIYVYYCTNTAHPFANPQIIKFNKIMLSATCPITCKLLEEREFEEEISGIKIYNCRNHGFHFKKISLNVLCGYMKNPENENDDFAALLTIYAICQEIIFTKIFKDNGPELEWLKKAVTNKKIFEIDEKHIQMIVSPQSKKSLMNLAIEAYDLDLVKYLVDNKYSINHLDLGKWSPLHTASAVGTISIASYLLENDSVIINIRDKYQKTPLHLAAQNGILEIVQILLDKNADKTALNIYGQTPADLAKLNNHTEVYNLLNNKICSIW